MSLYSWRLSWTHYEIFGIECQSTWQRQEKLSMRCLRVELFPFLRWQLYLWSGLRFGNKEVLQISLRIYKGKLINCFFISHITDHMDCARVRQAEFQNSFDCEWNSMGILNWRAAVGLFYELCILKYSQNENHDFRKIVRVLRIDKNNYPKWWMLIVKYNLPRLSLTQSISQSLFALSYTNYRVIIVR